MGTIFKFTQIPLHQFLTLSPIWYIFENNLFFSSEIIVIGYNKFYACVKFLGIVFFIEQSSHQIHFVFQSKFLRSVRGHTLRAFRSPLYVLWRFLDVFTIQPLSCYGLYVAKCL